MAPDAVLEWAKASGGRVQGVSPRKGSTGYSGYNVLVGRELDDYRYLYGVQIIAKKRITQSTARDLTNSSFGWIAIGVFQRLVQIRAKLTNNSKVEHTILNIRRKLLKCKGLITADGVACACPLKTAGIHYRQTPPAGCGQLLSRKQFSTRPPPSK